MKSFSRILATVFVLFITLTSYKFVLSSYKEERKEVVYKNYSLEQLKSYLSYKWIDISEKQQDKTHPYYWIFDFGSENSGAFRHRKEIDGRIYEGTDMPSFVIYKSGQQFKLKLKTLFMKSPDILIIQIISDQGHSFNSK